MFIPITCGSCSFESGGFIMYLLKYIFILLTHIVARDHWTDVDKHVTLQLLAAF